jgi:hypothetical protein
MASTSRALALVWVGVLCAFAPSFAQDGKGEETKPAPAPAEEKPDASELLKRMERLYPAAARRPTTDGQAEDPKVAAARAKEQDVWQANVRLLAKYGDDYKTAIGDAAPDARALFYRGAGKAIAAEIVGVGEKKDVTAAACESLTQYLDATDEKAAFRTDAEKHLVRALVLAGRVDDAAAHAGRAVELLQKEGRHDEAGVAAYDVLVALKARGQSKEMAAVAKAVHAADGDFGASTQSVRALLAASRLAVGSPLPTIAAVPDLDDKPISFAADGNPLLLHFFFTAVPGMGSAAKAEEIDAKIRPLWDAYHAKGLRVVGVCMDAAMTAAQAEKMRKNWDDWGKKDEFRDGSPASCREWVTKRGIEWTVRCSGQWTNDSVSKTLGGAGASDPYAVLVDKDGVVRWLGDPRTGDLADETAKLFK